LGLKIAVISRLNVLEGLYEDWSLKRHIVKLDVAELTIKNEKKMYDIYMEYAF
jgi:hypothetical protein